MVTFPKGYHLIGPHIKESNFIKTLDEIKLKPGEFVSDSVRFSDYHDMSIFLKCSKNSFRVFYSNGVSEAFENLFP